MKVILTTKPVSGDSNSTDVEVPATGTSVAEVLKSSGKSADKMSIAVNGKPAQLDTHVPAGATVTLTEKTRGS